MIVRGNVLALVGLDLCRAHHRGKIGILAAGLHHASPARVTRQIDHGREGNVNTGGSRLACGHLGALVKKCGIKAARHGRADRVDRAEAVNDVEHKEKRDPVMVLLQMPLLNHSDAFCSNTVEAGANS